MEEFIDNVKILINALGYKVLEPFAHVDSSSSNVDDELLYITSCSVNAIGKVTVKVLLCLLELVLIKEILQIL